MQFFIRFYRIPILKPFWNLPERLTWGVSPSSGRGIQLTSPFQRAGDFSIGRSSFSIWRFFMDPSTPNSIETRGSHDAISLRRLVSAVWFFSVVAWRPWSQNGGKSKARMGSRPYEHGNVGHSPNFDSNSDITLSLSNDGELRMLERDGRRSAFPSLIF